MQIKYILKSMDDLKKMLRSVINGQSALKEELLSKINYLDNKMDEGFQEMNERFDKMDKRIDKLGFQLADLEDDAPTREEHDVLEGRVVKMENKLQI